MTGSRLYVVWQGMKQRCFNPKNSGYQYYGGRGISVCEEWLNFDNFSKWAVDNGYDETAERGRCTLDRLDVNKDYSPDNCRWVDTKTQSRNKRNNRRLANGNILADEAIALKIPKETLRSRVVRGDDPYTRKCSHNRILVEGKTITELSEMCGISKSTLRARYYHGATTIEAITSPVEMLQVEGKTLKDLSKESGVNYSTLLHRYHKGIRTILEILEVK